MVSLAGLRPAAIASRFVRSTVIVSIPMIGRRASARTFQPCRFSSMATEWPTMPLPPATSATRSVPLLVISSLPIPTQNPSARSKRAQPAINDEIGAGNVAAFVGSQEQRRSGNLLGAAKAVERSGGPKARPYRVSAFFRCRLRVDDGRVNRAGTDRVDTDATVLEFRRPRANKRANAGFGCAVSGVARNALERGN